MYACVHAYVRACVHVRMHMHMHACTCMQACVVRVHDVHDFDLMLAQVLSIESLLGPFRRLDCDAFRACALDNCRSKFGVAARILDSDDITLLERDRLAVVCHITEPVGAP